MTIEESFAFGPSRSLVGTLTRSSVAASATAAQGVILFNAGVLHRVGPHRLNVKIARRLAALGLPTLRFDLHGHGDSLRPPAGPSYHEQVDADLLAAADELARRTGVAHFAILGFCSGAYPAYRAALADPRVDAVLLYDAFIYPTLRSRLHHAAVRLRHHGVRGVLSRGLPMRLLRRVHQAYAGRRDTPRAMADEDSPVTRRELVQGLNRLTQRGVNVLVAFSGGSFDQANYAGQFRDATRRNGLSPQVRVAFEPHINHVVTSLASQEIFMDLVLRQWLGVAGAAPMPPAA